MKKLFYLFIGLLLLSTPLLAADVKISELPAVTSTTPATDIVPIVASGVTSKITINNLLSGYQPALDLLKGTLTNGYICTYTASGTLLSCNTNPATFQTALAYPVTGVASPTAGYLAKWGASGNAIVDGPQLGTLTNNKWCSFTTAGGIACTENAPGAGGSVATDTIFDAAGDLVQGTGADASVKLTKGAAGTLLRAGASTNAWSTFTFADTYAIGTIPYASTANTITALAHPGAADYFIGSTGATTLGWRTVAQVKTSLGYLDSANISNTAYDATTWDAVDTIAPSKNAIRDYLESKMPAGTDGTHGLGITNNTSAFTPTTGNWFTFIANVPYFIVGATQTRIPGLAATISDGDTTHAPDGNSVFDALALKAPLASPTFTGTTTLPDSPSCPTYASTSTATGNINIDGAAYCDYNFADGATAVTYTPIITAPPASGKVRYVTLTLGGGSGVVTITSTNITWMDTAPTVTTTNKKSTFVCIIPNSGNAICKIVKEAY